ncbi:WD repeat and coiled-coil-containing protein-like [Argonauta hians]
MEVGNVTLGTKGLNILRSSIHTKHGLVWTDGKSVYLAKFEVRKNQVQPGKSIKIKEFEFVKGVHWSSQNLTETCYLSISHDDSIGIWKVEGEAPNLSLKQIRRICLDSIPQGCLWNPCRELLCMLSREQIRFFYRQGKIRGVYSIPPLESGKISCGAWSKDGLKLVVCVGSAILIYTWKAINGAISEFDTNVWKIPELNGTVTAITSMQDNLFACAAEVPFELLCKKTDEFGFSETKHKTLTQENDNGDTSNLNKLMNIPRNTQCDVNNLSQLLVIRVKENMKDPESVTRISVKGIITPDLLHFQTLKQVLIVGSNLQTSLQLFNFLASSKLTKLANVELEAHSRPKGVCSLPHDFSSNCSNSNMLIMLGKQSETNSSVFSTSTNTQYELWLQCFSLDNARTSAKTCPKPTACEQDQTNGHSNDITLVRSRQSSVDSNPDFSSNSNLREDRISGLKRTPPNPATRTISSKCLIEELGETEKFKELEIESANFSASEANFSHSNSSSGLSSCSVSTVESVMKIIHEQSNGNQECASESGYSVNSPISPRSPLVNGYDQNENYLLDNGYQHLEDKLKFQNNQIAELEKKIEELRSEVDKSSCIFPTKYYPMKAPEIINLVHVISSGISIKKTFLLDHGRLHMESVKQSFGLNTIELYMDDIPVIISANIDGYIPLKFEPNSTVFISGVTSPPQEDSISVSSLASSAVFPQSPLNEGKRATDLTVTGALTPPVKGKATTC